MMLLNKTEQNLLIFVLFSFCKYKILPELSISLYQLQQRVRNISISNTW